jgi:DNA-binding CsgD family transcriptional regulator
VEEGLTVRGHLSLHAPVAGASSAYDLRVSAASGILERDTELVRIADALDSAVAGAGRVIVIEGAAGIGKTRLVRETRELAARRGFGRLQATGDETETSMAWGVVRQMVERSVTRYAGEVRRAILDGPAGAALRALDGAPDAATGDVGDAGLAGTLHALWWVAIDLSASRPLLITVDDAQWADQPSLRFLGYLARRVADLPIALVVATRPPSGGTGPLTELTVSPHVERLLPDPLTPDAVAEFSTPDGAVPCREVADAMHAACGGNPFLTGALLDELVSEGLDVTRPETAGAIGGLGPSTISRAMLSRLSPQALALAGAAAVLGINADPWLAGGVARVPAEGLAGAVDLLVRDNVLIGGADGLTFVHPVIREATLAALGPLEIATFHARAAAELQTRHAPPTQLAPHLLAAPVGTLADAPDLLARAAAESAAAGDTAVAAACLERALAERPGDPGLRERLGRILLVAGRAGEARHHLRAAAAEATDVRRRAELLAAASQATLDLEGPVAAVAELVETLAGWPPVTEEPARLVLEARLGVTRSFVPAQRRVADEHLHRFAHLTGATPEERTLLALQAQRGRYLSEHHTVVADLARRALASGALFDDAARGGGLVGWVLAMMSLITADGIAEARTEIDRARVRVQRAGSPVDFAMVANCAMVTAWRVGDVDATEAEAEAVLAAVAHEPPGPEVVSLRATAAHLGGYTALERRDLPRARAWVEEFDAGTGGLSVIPMLWLLELRARISLAADDPHGALRHVETLRREAEAADVDPAALAWRLPAAIAYSRLEDLDHARAALDDHLALTRRSGSPTDVGAAIRVAARFEQDAERREELLTEAVGLLEGAHDRLERAKALADLAETRRALGRRTESRELLERAAELALECGATALQTRIGDAFLALGDRPRRLLAPGPESLTASERRVARLAVAGRSNRDIAVELFVSPKTVENHLGRVYTKLGIAGRRELAVALT